MSNIVKHLPPAQCEDYTDQVRPSLRSVRSKKTIDRWIGEQLTGIDKDGPLTAFVLEKLNGNTGQHLYTKTIGQNPINANDVGRVLYDVAQTDCQDLTGNHTYRVSAFFDSRPQAEAFYNFTLQGQQDPDFMGTENPTREGLLSHGLNYATRTMNRALDALTASHDLNNQTMQIQGSTISRLLVENHAAYETMKNLMVERALQESRMNFEQAKYNRSTAERKEWLGMAMPLANRILGREVFPYESEDSAIMKQIADLPATKLEQLANVFHDNPKLLAVIAARLDQLIDSGDKPTRHREEALASKEDPETEFERPLLVQRPARTPAVQSPPSEENSVTPEQIARLLLDPKALELIKKELAERTAASDPEK